MKKTFVLGMAFAFFLTSCTDDDVSGGASGHGIVFTSTIASRATDMSFEPDDAIGVSMSVNGSFAGGASNIQYVTSDGSSFTSQSPITWGMIGDASETGFAGVYPHRADAVSDGIYSFSLSTGDGVALSANDVMYAYASDVLWGQENVPLRFVHKLVKVVTQVCDTDGNNVSGASVKIDKQQTAGTLNLADGTVTVAGSQDAVLDFAANPDVTGRYQTIVLPSDAVEGRCITVAYDGKDYACPVDAYKFESGKQVTISVVLNPDGSVSTGESVKIRVDIGDWNDEIAMSGWVFGSGEDFDTEGKSNYLLASNVSLTTAKVLVGDFEGEELDSKDVYRFVYTRSNAAEPGVLRVFSLDAYSKVKEYVLPAGQTNGTILVGVGENKKGIAVSSTTEGLVLNDVSVYTSKEIIPPVVAEVVSPKLTSGNANPLLDFMFVADPTAIEHEGRLYVYGTNDQQQYEENGGDKQNSYECIKSLVVMSTDDMVNWTYHGTIKVDEIAPWILASWAPSIVKREESDGKTHFYLYFSNSGYGTGVLTATSPLGPWTSPLDKSLIDGSTAGLGEITIPFDPGAVIDDNGKGWLTIGADGHPGIFRLGDDMISIDSEIKAIDAPFQFEANELNYINGTYVYTYNVAWEGDFTTWPQPSGNLTPCCMVYMKTKDPLGDEWTYGNNYLKNPGDYGFDFSNNHTHLQKFGDKWYIFYHAMSLQHSFNTDKGFRNINVDEINVDEDEVRIDMGTQTLKGVSQIKPLNPFAEQQAETTAATQDLKFCEDEESGDIWVVNSPGRVSVLAVRGAEFNRSPSALKIKASGHGKIIVRKGSVKGEIIASIPVESDEMKLFESEVGNVDSDEKVDLCFLLSGAGVYFDQWQFE